jgi:hypothetical protein
MGKNQFRTPKIAFALREQTASKNQAPTESAVLLQFGEAFIDSSIPTTAQQ